MRVYLDSSVIVPLVTLDPFNDRVDAFLQNVQPVVIVSDFASAEVSSAIARRVRTGDLTRNEARMAFANLDAWVQQQARRVVLENPDVSLAEQFVRRLDSNLRAPDAIHIAVAIRLSLTLVSLDGAMRAAAQRLGCPVIEP